VGRARRGGKERDKRRDDQTKEGGGRRGRWWWWWGSGRRQTVVFILRALGKVFRRSSTTCLSDPPGRDEAVVQEEAHLGLLNERERARETRGAHSALTRRSRSLTLLVMCEY
jgi:hypothetical protein